jgi:hypothetical protein
MIQVTGMMPQGVTCESICFNTVLSALNGQGPPAPGGCCTQVSSTHFCAHSSGHACWTRTTLARHLVVFIRKGLIEGVYQPSLTEMIASVNDENG